MMDWEKVPEWAQYVTCDSYGAVVAHQFQPRPIPSWGVWHSRGRTVVLGAQQPSPTWLVEVAMRPEVPSETP